MFQKFRDHVARLFVKPANHIERLLHASVGVAGEGGELLDVVKKTWIYNKPLDEDNLKEECGDTLFYIQAILNEMGWDMEEVMQENIEKLRARYPDGYTDEAAQARRDKA